MSLLERIAARKCAVEECPEARHPDSRFCRDDMREDFMRRLDYLPDGRIVRRRLFPPRDMTWTGAAA